MEKLVVLIMSLIFGVSVHGSPKPSKDVIGMDKAKQIASKAASGNIKEGELEFEDGQWVYSFDIVGEDEKINEVQVNAKDGSIVSKKVESAADEAAEKKNDVKTK